MVATTAILAGSFTGALIGSPGLAAAAPCTAFPANNVWNIDVSSLPVDPHSAAWLASANASSTNLHPDFGPAPYGFPFALVTDAHPTVTVRFTYADESDPGPYPFGPDTPLESGSDRHALMVNVQHCVLYELYAAYWNRGNPKAGSGAVFDLASNAPRPDGWTSADAAGFAITPGLVRMDEVRAGAINHAIRFTVANTDCRHVWPARHNAGTCNTNYPPMGARFRLKAGYSLAGFSPQAQVILTAMKRYGLFLADNGSNFFFQGTQDARWTNSLLDELKSVPASAFEVIDESCLMVAPNSGAADPTRC